MAEITQTNIAAGSSSQIQIPYTFEDSRRRCYKVVSSSVCGTETDSKSIGPIFLQANTTLPTGVFEIPRPADTTDSRYDFGSHLDRMTSVVCPDISSPVSSGDNICQCHSVLAGSLAAGGLVGGQTRWNLEELNNAGADECYFSWWGRFVNRENVIDTSTKFYGISARSTQGFAARNTATQTVAQWEAAYLQNIGGQGGGGAGWYHGIPAPGAAPDGSPAGGPNGLGKSWSVRLLHKPGIFTGPFTNTGIICAETYHTDSDNFQFNNGVTRQFGRSFQATNNAVGVGRITDDSWNHYCIRVKMNSLSANPFTSINRDGILQVWVNSVLLIDRQNLHWTEDPAFRDFRGWTLVFGGGDDPNNVPWQMYSDGIRYSATGCSIA